MSIFRLAYLPNQYPTLQEVIVEIGTPAKYKESLDKMIEELASGKYNVADGQQLLVDLQFVQDSDWVMGFGGPPEGIYVDSDWSMGFRRAPEGMVMVSRAILLKRTSAV